MFCMFSYYTPEILRFCVDLFCSCQWGFLIQWICLMLLKLHHCDKKVRLGWEIMTGHKFTKVVKHTKF